MTVIESIRVRCILLWHAQRWSKERAAKHSAYFARISAAELAAAKHRAEDEAHSDDEGRPAKAVFRRSSRLKRDISASSAASSVAR